MKVEETTVTAFWLSAGGWDGESELLYETGALDGDAVSVEDPATGSVSSSAPFTHAPWGGFE